MTSATLRTNNATDQIALRGVDVHAVLAGMSQRTTVRQTFVNLESKPIEAVYTFPVPDGAAVCGFEVITGDRVLTGEIDETEKATETYENAIAAGDAAFSLDRERPDVFSLRVGNLKPKQAVTIKLIYVAVLEPVDGKIRFTFPTTIAPRYLTSAGMDPVDGAIDGDALNPPHLLSVPYGLTFTADVRLGRAVRQITSPTHAVQTTGDDHAGYVVRFPAVTAMDREVVLSIELTTAPGPSVQVESNADGKHYLAVTFAPEFDDAGDPPATGETVFLIDCSGSMAGQSIAQATAAVELCLRSLSAGDRFNICRFGSSFQMMSPEPLVYSQQTLDAAVKFVQQDANLGGTELLGALQHVLDPATSGVRNVLLMTDGQVSNEPAVLALARRWKRSNRIFSFGIGTAASSSLVRGLARVTHGAAEFITANERIDEKVLRTFARLASPAVSGIAIDWGGAAVKTAGSIPPVFDGDLVTVFGQCEGPLPGRITLRGETAAGTRSWPVDVPAFVAKDFTIATNWARREIEELEDVAGITRSAVATGSSPGRETMIRLSKQFGVMSPLTTFIAVEYRPAEEKTAGRPASRRVPVMLAAGWGGVALAAPAGGVQAGLMRKRSMTGGGGSRGGGSYRDVAPMAAPPPSPMMAMPAASASRPAPPRVRAEPAADSFAVILSGQNAAGAFVWNDAMSSIGRTVPGWAEVVGAIEAGFSAVEVVETLKALVLLRSRFAGEEALWKRAAAKAASFVAGKTGKTVAEVRVFLDGMIALRR